MKRVLHYLDKFFFTEDRSLNLGLLRIALVLIWIYRIWRDHRMMNSFVSVNEQLNSIHRPSYLIDLLGVPFPLSESYAFLFGGIYYTVAVCALIGLCTRPTLFLFALMNIYINDVMASRGFFNHESSLTTQVLLILAVAPGATRFSVDNVLRWLFVQKSRSMASFVQALVGRPAAVWGFKTILILLACTYVTAGISKLRYGGLEWLDGQTLTHYLDGSAQASNFGEKIMLIGPQDVPEAAKWKDGYGVYSYTYGNRQEKEINLAVGRYIASTPALISAVSIATVLFELLGFVLLLGGWWRVLYLLGAIAMHRSIGFLMYLPFTEYQLICFLLIDWWWVYQHLGVGFKRKLEPIISRATARIAH